MTIEPNYTCISAPNPVTICGTTDSSTAADFTSSEKQPSCEDTSSIIASAIEDEDLMGLTPCSTCSTTPRGGRPTNIFTTSVTNKAQYPQEEGGNGGAKLSLRQDLPSTIEHQRESVAQIKKMRHELWVAFHRNRTTPQLLSASQAAWAGKALLSEAVRYQYHYQSKKLTNALLERYPLLQQAQRHHEDDVAFSLEEVERVRLVEKALKQLPGFLTTMTPEQQALAREEMDRKIEAPEIDPRDIVAPTAPEIIRSLWHDFDVHLGVAANDADGGSGDDTDVSLKISTKAESDEEDEDASFFTAKAETGATLTTGPSAVFLAPAEVKATYAKTIGIFTQLQLWQVKRTKCKYSAPAAAAAPAHFK